MADEAQKINITTPKGDPPIPDDIEVDPNNAELQPITMTSPSWFG